MTLCIKVVDLIDTIFFVWVGLPSRVGLLNKDDDDDCFSQGNFSLEGLLTALPLKGKPNTMKNITASFIALENSGKNKFGEFMSEK